MDWNDVRYFLALARLGSVRAAGAALGVSHSTVSRRVEALEGQLSARLFDRSRDGYLLTEAGRQMLPGAESVEREMIALERELAGQDRRLAGTVSLTCCDEYVSDMMLSDIAQLCAQHPGIEVSMTADSRPFDLSRREADIAVRILAAHSSPPEHLIGQKLAALHFTEYVAVAHADRLDPARPGSQPRWAAFSDRRAMAAQVALTPYAEVPLWGRFASLRLAAQAATHGLGIVTLPCYVGDGTPALRRLDDRPPRHLADLWLLSHPDLRTNARLRAARTCVAESLRRRVSLFRGY